MKRVTYKQRGDDSVMFEIKCKPSKAKDFRHKLKAHAWLYSHIQTSQQLINYTSFNNQEGEE